MQIGNVLIGMDQIDRPAPKWVVSASFVSIVVLPFVLAVIIGTPSEFISQLWTNYLTLIFSALASAFKALETFSGNGTKVILQPPPPTPPSDN